jgi:FMN phosphatase YigB (HAD superfamily)
VTATLVVDFGDTLVDETFMWRDDGRFPDWTAHYGPVVRRHARSWDLGTISTTQVAQEVARSLGSPVAEVEDHIEDLCRSISFHPRINAALDRRRARSGRQALVTVNPDLFHRIVELHDLSSRFDVIVTSADVGTDDKKEMCRIACERLQAELDTTALIDDIEANVEAWVAAGGKGYVFRTDDRFASDVSVGRVPGFEPGDVI